MKRSIMIIIIISSTIIISAQTIVLKGERNIVSKKNNPELKCTPVKITTTMKITKVDGNCKGFWIQKGSETIHKFNNLADPIGTVLSAGTYYVYPYFKDDAKKADIRVTLKPNNKSG
ncbi:MAG: hypothetical protein HQ521_11655 [Bacteroidetes bacterium]|nr:hypothetical protein [Bacteroidota bacterium]